ncbi:hypothetical protein [Nocardia gipuzkoensis]|uniref:hypothetical protein n=1 Tax=Nocardia gipuzkoensis TaxID=2749991 RepID=UPI00237DEDA4|nr:hypothetical protein [Nocardia gipuzkoensis]MDE1674329.1 hypothetical protein [Nocardia gipuzkoensis]
MSKTMFLSASIWPLLIFMTVVLVVTVVALIRAPKKDIARIFEAFAAAFGIHKAAGPTTPEPEGDSSTDEDDGTINEDDGTIDQLQEGQ